MYAKNCILVVGYIGIDFSVYNWDRDDITLVWNSGILLGRCGFCAFQCIVLGNSFIYINYVWRKKPQMFMHLTTQFLFYIFYHKCIGGNSSIPWSRWRLLSPPLPPRTTCSWWWLSGWFWYWWWLIPPCWWWWLLPRQAYFGTVHVRVLWRCVYLFMFGQGGSLVLMGVS